jgi:transposase
MPQRPVVPEDPKAVALRTAGALHPHPDVVQDALFVGSAFFDPRDRVQVKYEMLRRQQVEGQPVTAVAAAFGVSRQAFYTTQTAFTAQGLPGLLPRPRGPQRAHKCTPAILAFARQWRVAHPTAPAADGAAAVHAQFGVTLHPRTLVRALARPEKKHRAGPGR